MTIEEEIRQRLRAMGMDEESVGPCMAHIKADTLCRTFKDYCKEPSKYWSTECIQSFWVCAHSSAMDWLALEITAPFDLAAEQEAREQHNACNNGGGDFFGDGLEVI